MNATRYGLLLACVLCAAAACGGEARPSAEPAPEPAPAPAADPTLAPAPTPPPVAAQEPANLEPTPEELPVDEDFEAEAEQEVTLANYRAELDELEKEIEAKN